MYMVFKFISLPVFIISVAVGLFFVYISNPPHTTVYVYPTPDNVNKIEYKDMADNCFRFVPSEISCPSNKDEIKTIPVQK